MKRPTRRVARAAGDGVYPRPSRLCGQPQSGGEPRPRAEVACQGGWDEQRFEDCVEVCGGVSPHAPSRPHTRTHTHARTVGRGEEWAIEGQVASAGYPPDDQQRRDDLLSRELAAGADAVARAQARRRAAAEDEEQHAEHEAQEADQQRIDCGTVAGEGSAQRSDRRDLRRQRVQHRGDGARLEPTARSCGGQRGVRRLEVSSRLHSGPRGKVPLWLRRRLLASGRLRRYRGAPHPMERQLLLALLRGLDGVDREVLRGVHHG